MCISTPTQASERVHERLARVAVLVLFTHDCSARGGMASWLHPRVSRTASGRAPFRCQSRRELAVRRATRDRACTSCPRVCQGFYGCVIMQLAAWWLDLATIFSVIRNQYSTREQTAKTTVCSQFSSSSPALTRLLRVV